MTPQAPLTSLSDLRGALARSGYAVLDAASVTHLAQLAPGALGPWAAAWDDMPRDPYLRDGGRYRRRRHGSLVVDLGAAFGRVDGSPGGGAGTSSAPALAHTGPVGQVSLAPHRAHWQPLDYNALHGGLERWFEPLPESLSSSAALRALLLALAELAEGLRPGTRRWYAEVHAFRIECSEGIGRPTPEGAHRDGVDLVAVLLVARQGIKGGETRVFDAHGPQGTRFTLTEPWSALILDDERVIHESTPIQPLDAAAPNAAHRDTLVITLRRQGFQDAPA